MGITYLIKIFRNLYLHVVGYSLVFLDTCEELVELIVILHAKQLPDHSEHTVNALCKRLYLLACLQHRKLWCSHKGTAADVAQTEVILVLAHIWLDNSTYELLHLRYEPYKNSRVAYVECCVESCKHYRQATGVDVVGIRVYTHKATNHVDERIEATQHPYYAEHVERQVGKGSSASLCVCSHGGNV